MCTWYIYLCIGSPSWHYILPMRNIKVFYHQHLASITWTPLAKNEAERRAVEESKQEVEARCAVLQETTSRLEGDLARLTAQVR